MNNVIKVQVKSHYGNEHIYIISEHNESIKSLTGRKTITRNDIQSLKELGFTFEVVNTINV